MVYFLVKFVWIIAARLLNPYLIPKLLTRFSFVQKYRLIEGVGLFLSIVPYDIILGAITRNLDSSSVAPKMTS